MNEHECQNKDPDLFGTQESIRSTKTNSSSVLIYAEIIYLYMYFLLSNFRFIDVFLPVSLFLRHFVDLLVRLSLFLPLFLKVLNQLYLLCRRMQIATLLLCVVPTLQLFGFDFRRKYIFYDQEAYSGIMRRERMAKYFCPPPHLKNTKNLDK